MRRALFFIVVALCVFGLAATSLAQLPPGGTFSDDNGNLHEGFIEAIAEAGVTLGCEPGLYCPADSVTRGQMASFLARAFAFPAASKDYFPDDTGSTHEDNINRIAEAGVTLGFPDGTYQPAGSVTREQMGSFIARAMGLTPVVGDRFDDVSGTHEPNINAIAEAGVTLGCNPAGTLYCPTELVRRDQMASFLGRALGLKPIIPPPPAGTLFSGPLQSQPGLTGEISFEVTPGNDEVKNPTLDLVLDSYQCPGVKVSGNGKSTLFITVPVVNGSFSYNGGLLTWNGTFGSPTTASGTISGSMLLGTSCDWGPISWSAASSG